MESVLLVDALVFPTSSSFGPRAPAAALVPISVAVSPSARRGGCASRGLLASRRVAASREGALTTDGSSSSPSSSRAYTVGDFMTKREKLDVVKPTTTVDRSLELLVEKKIAGFPVIDDNWRLVGVVSDYDLLALESVSGTCSDTGLFPAVDSTWKAFNRIQKLLSKTNGKVISDVMTPFPLVVRESSNLEDAARLLLETKYRQLPVVDAAGRLVGVITRGNVIRAAIQIKREDEMAARA